MGPTFLDILNGPIWKSLLSRLLLDVDPPYLNGRLLPGLRRFRFLYHSDAPLNGIISHLTSEYGGNVIDKGVVDVRASSLYQHSAYKLSHAVELNSLNDFLTASLPDQSITYDFKNRRIGLSGYAIRSRTHSQWGAYGNMKSWVIETSTDGQSWTVIDKRNDETCLNGRALTQHFAVRSSRPCRFIQLRQLGGSHMNCQYLAFSALEFFGQVWLLKDAQS
jgi:hypothetical protein